MSKIINLYRSAIPKNIRQNFNIIVFMFFINGIFTGIYAPFWGIIAREQYKAGPFLIGLVLSAQYIYGIVAMIVSGFVPAGEEQKWSKNIRIVTSIFLILAPFMPNGVWFCVFLFLFHVTACYVPCDNAVFAYVFPLNIRAKMLGYTKMVQSIVSVIITLIAGMFINVTLFGFPLWKGMFVIAGLSMISVGFIIGRVKLQNVEHEEKVNPIEFIKNSFKLLEKDKFNTFLIISGVFFTIGYTIFTTLSPIYQVDILKISGREVSFITVGGSIALIIAYPFLGAFFSKLNPIKAWMCVYPLMVIFPLFYMFIGKSWVPLILGNILHQGFIVTNDIAWINIIIYLGGKEKIKEYQGLYSFFIGIRALIGLFVSTFIIEHCEKLNFTMAINYKIAFGISILFSIISAVLMIPVLRMKK